MNIEQMQKEFETAVALEAGEPTLAVYLSRRGDTYGTSALHFAWWAWKASRAAVVVQLPPPYPAPEEPEFALDDSHMDAYHVANGMRCACQSAIKKAGLQVTP